MIPKLSILKKIEFQILKDLGYTPSDEERVEMAQSLLNSYIDPGDTIVDAEMPIAMFGTTLDWAAGGINETTVEISLGTFSVEQDLALENNVIANSADTTPPAEVTSLTAAVGENQSNLTWTNPVDADFDHVEVWYGIGSPTTEFIGTILNTGTLITGLTNGSEYIFLVKTVDIYSNISVGASTVVTPLDVTPPAEVTLLSATTEDNQSTLTWTNPVDSDFDHVEVWYGIGSPTTEFVGTILNTGTLITSLTSGSEYIFLVKAVDNVGNTTTGSSATATPTDGIPPAEVTSLSASADNTQSTLTWTNPVDADFDHNEIWYGIGSPTVLFTGTIINTGTLITPLTNNSEYTFLVKTVDTNDNISIGISTTATPFAVDFVSSWKTDNTGIIVSGSDQVKLPLDGTGTYDFDVNWGDGNTDTITSAYQAEAVHTYATAGSYDVTINGKCEGFGFTTSGRDNSKLIDIKQWGSVKLHNEAFKFYGCNNLPGFSAIDVLDTSNITYMSGLFHGATIFNSDLSSWDTSNVTNMNYIFKEATAFNGDISSWNTSNVTTITGAFDTASAFNSDISLWNTSSVETISYMFDNATVFNGDISLWNTSSVTNMSNVFNGALAFDGNLSLWNTSSVETISNMFNGAIAFNGDLSSWNTSSVTDMGSVFRAANYDQSLGDWDISNVIGMDSMFYTAITTLSPTNYDATLNGWATISGLETKIPTNITFSAGGAKHTEAGQAARDLLIGTYGWTIADGGLYDSIPPAEVTSLTATIEDSQSTLTWTNPVDADFDHVEIWYGIGNTNTEFLGTILNTGTLITGLTNGSEYTFLVKTVDSTGNISTGAQTTITPSLSWDTGTKMVASDAAAGDIFGEAIAMDGNYMIIGAPKEDAGGSDAGAAYIFYKTGLNTWDAGTKIVASDPDLTDNFGKSVSINGDYVVVGAYREDAGGADAGAAYVFNRTGTNTWDAGTKIVASDAAAGDNFGRSVSISGDYVVVGAYLDNGAGSAYIFNRTGTNTWDAGTKIVSSDIEAGDNFGWAVAVSGDYVVVGAAYEDASALDAGAAYVFNRTGTNTWDAGTKIVASDITTQDAFGYSVSMDGDYILVGCIYGGGNTYSSGSAYIFNRTGTNTWDAGTKIIASDGENNNIYSYSVSMSGDHVAVGAYSKNVGEVLYAGSVYIYSRTGINTWVEDIKLVASDAGESDNFGRSVSISGDYVVVGAPKEDAGGADAGAAYMFYYS